MENDEFRGVLATAFAGKSFTSSFERAPAAVVLPRYRGAETADGKSVEGLAPLADTSGDILHSLVAGWAFHE